MVHGKVLRIAPLGCAGGDEQLRHLLGVHVFLDRRIRRRAEALEDQQDLVALDQLARLLDRLGRAVAVVVGDEVDLAAVDAAFGVDLLEIGRDRLADQAVGRGRTAIGIDVADLDLGVAGAGIVFLLRERRGRRDRQPRTRSAVNSRMRFFICFLPFVYRASESRRASLLPISRTSPAAPDGIR